jgi:ABC-type bacteriocin/lantibiotic exporter with double-glycine peptidase domain
LKPVLRPLPASRFQDNWKDGVCLQSTSASCGVASAATLLASFGIKATEAELARECFTCSSGTEAWYLARMFRRRGFSVIFHAARPVDRLPVPAIAGVKVDGFGHFIPIIARTTAGYTTGDPLDGRQEYTGNQIGRQFQFTGFFLEIQPKPAKERQ